MTSVCTWAGLGTVNQHTWAQLRLYGKYLSNVMINLVVTGKYVYLD